MILLDREFGTPDARVSRGEPPTTVVFAFAGECWTFRHIDQTFRLKNSKGLAYIHRLLQHPGEEIHALDLLSGPGVAVSDGSVNDAAPTDGTLSVGRLGDAGEMLDTKAKQDYKRRLIELREELEDQREFGNRERAAEIDSEIDFLAREISRAVGLGGRDRRAGSAAERARLNVTRAIKSAIQKISEHNSGLAELLSRSIQTGSFCTFVQDSHAKIKWMLSQDEHESELETADSAPSRFSQPSNLLQIKADRTKFVGRDVEQTTLRRCLDLARAGNGSIVTIAGSPGVGKTRIASEIALEASRIGFFTLVGCCYDREDSVPFNPFVEILESALVQTPSREIFKRMLGDAAGELARLMPQLRRIFVDLPATLEVSPEQSRRLLLNSFVDFLTRALTSGPVLLLIDDLHWADEGTFSLLNHIARFVAKAPIVVLVTYRDNELDRSGGLAATLDACTRLHVLERINLSNLSENDAAEMIAALSGRKPPEAAVDFIYSGSEGNPFFVEELFQHLKERGTLLDSKGHFRRDLSLDLDHSDVPESLRLIIGRRLARLSADARKFLDTAAVIGRSFTFGLLEASTRANSEDLLNSVEEAEESGLISSSVAYPEARFQFSHELIRQAVLAELSAPRYQRINLRIADAIERIFVGGVQEQVLDLAHHLWLAGSVAEPERTIKYLTLAAAQARVQSAYESAILHFRNALTLVKRLPTNDERDHRELDIYVQYLTVLSFTNQFTTTAAGRSYARAKELCERLGQASTMYALLAGNSSFHLRRGELHKSHDLASQILELSESSSRPEWAVTAHYMIGHALCCLGDLVLAHEHLSEAARLRDCMPPTIVDGVTEKVCALAVDAMTLWTLGYADRAMARIDEVIVYSQDSANPYDLVLALTYAHIVTLFRREFTRSLEFADRGLQIAAEKKFEWVQTALAWSRDCCLIFAGLDKNIAKPRSAFELYFGSEAKLYKPDNCTVLAECCGVVQQAEVGLPMIDEAFSAIKETDERRGEPETWRVKGTLLLQLANRRDYREKSAEVLMVEAEACFRTAIEIARAQSSKAWELRAAINLSRLLIASNRQKEARRELLLVLDWFTEGFDTPDVLEATALLQELRDLPASEHRRNGIQD